MMWGYSPNWGSMFLMMVLSNLLWIGLLAILVWAVIRWFERRSGGSGSHEPLARELSAMEILRQRYARGEMDEATFERMRERLETRREHEY
jgi:putative membrane protein